MGAFDSELYALGFRFNNGSTTTKPKKPSKKEIWLENLHTPKMPCPGSCGAACPNHYCEAHNGNPYEPQPPKVLWSIIKQQRKDTEEVLRIKQKIAKLELKLKELNEN